MRSAIQRKVQDAHCRACGASGDLDPAHTIPRSLGGKNNADSVIPLCRFCHDCQHGKNGKALQLELLPLMTIDEQVEAVRVVGIARAYAYLTRGGS